MQRAGSERHGAAVAGFALVVATIPLLGYAGLSVPGLPMGATVIPFDLTHVAFSLLIGLAALLGFPRASQSEGLSAVQRLAIIALILAMVCGTLFNALWPEWAALRYLTRLPAILGAFALLYLLNRAPPKAAAWIVFALVLQPLIHIPALAHSLATDLGDPEVNWNSGPAGYANVRVWGMLCATAFALVLGWMTATEDRRPRIWGFAALTVLALLLVFSGTRTGIVGIGAGFAAIFLVDRRRALRILGLGLGALLIGGTLSLLLPLPSENYGLFNSIERAAGGVDGRDASSGRLTLWLTGARMIGDHPLFGHGLDQLILFNPPEFTQHHLHNSPLQLLFDFGLIGGTAAILLLAMIWARALGPTRQPRTDSQSAARIGLIALIAMSPLEDILYHPDILAATMMLSAVLLARAQPKS